MFFGPTCLFCGYCPCSVDATICPHCGHAAPNPGLRTRLACIIDSFWGVLGVAIMGAVFAGMAGAVHISAAIVVAACFLLWAVLHVAKAVWYAIDPTLSILPRPRVG